MDAAVGTQPDSSTGQQQPDAPTTTTRDPAVDGDFTVTSTGATIPGYTSGRSVPATIFTPSGPTTGRPLVVVSPGFQMDRAQYTSYAHHLATWGFVVILADYADSGFFADHTNMAKDVQAVITWALAQSSLGIDPQKIATAGHSLGGKISVYAASIDNRVKAVVAWDPVDSNSPSVAPEKMTSMTAAIAVIGETTDSTSTGFGQACAPTSDNFLTFYAASPSPALSVTVAGADHMDWVDDPSCFACGFCDEGTAPADLARTVSRRIDVAWLRRRLLADTAMDTWLASPPEAASLTITKK